ncbi:MAG: hypothetical protein LH632_03380 [Rhodoferax sp.]|nr:hypothetical protein [Rhodoferax sp.]
MNRASKLTEPRGNAKRIQQGLGNITGMEWVDFSKGRGTGREIRSGYLHAQTPP